MFTYTAFPVIIISISIIIIQCNSAPITRWT